MANGPARHAPRRGACSKIKRPLPVRLDQRSALIRASLATGSFREAVALRNCGVNLPILMFGHCLPQAYPALIGNNLIPTLHAQGQAEALNEAPCQRTVDVFIKVHAGLGRRGYPIDTAEAAIVEMAHLPRLSLNGLYSHLPF